MEINVKPFVLTSKMKQICFIMIGLGVIGTALSFWTNPVAGWIEYLVNNVFFILVALAGVFFVCVQGLVSGSWVSPFRRVMEGMASYLPFSILMMIPIIFGMHTIYEWTHLDVVNNDPILIQKKPWLNETFFIIRMFSYLFIWSAIAWSQRKMSLAQDKEPTKDFGFSIVRNASIHTILFGFTICFASFDWLMSIEPHWFSTIYGVYFFAGSFVSGICFLIIAMIQLSERGYFGNHITQDHYHDLGKWLFGMCTFWAYIWVSQFLLIWYANIPEETEYFVLRAHHWWWPMVALLVLHWGFPFFALMTRKAKRNPKVIQAVAAVVLVAHFLDLYIMSAPLPFHHADIHHVPAFGLYAVLQWTGFAGIFLLVVGRSLSKASLFNTGDPNLEEGLHLHQ